MSAPGDRPGDGGGAANLADRRWFRYVVVLAIGAAVFLLFDRFGPYQSGTGYRARPVERVSAGSAELEPAIDGHYHITAQVNGEPLVFMIDTGASGIAVDPETARRIKLDMTRCRDARYSTAAGTVGGCDTTAREIRVAGLVLRDLRVAVLPAPGERLALLGMSVLKHFKLETEGSKLRLTPLP